jgi:hypothetical protein
LAPEEISVSVMPAPPTRSSLPSSLPPITYFLHCNTTLLVLS